MKLYPNPIYEPIPVKDLIPKSLGTRSQRINPWITADEPAATICKTAAGYELKEVQIRPTCQSYRVLIGQPSSDDAGFQVAHSCGCNLGGLQRRVVEAP